MYPYQAYGWQHPAHRGEIRQAGGASVPYVPPYVAYPYGSYSYGLPQRYGSTYAGSVGYPARQQGEERSETRQDHGPNPYVVDIEEATEQNPYFRSALWTGQHMQVVLMSIRPGEDIGLEVHPDVDQFIRIEDGEGLVQMGPSRDRLDYQRRVEDGSAIMIPAGTYHNVTNIGNEPLKLYTIYAPPEHPHGTVHRTKAEAMAAEGVRES